MPAMTGTRLGFESGIAGGIVTADTVPEVVILLDAADLSASRPGKPLFHDVSVTVSSGDRLAVVGINGTGKSTLLRQLAGTIPLETGTLRRGRGTRVVM